VPYECTGWRSVISFGCLCPREREPVAHWIEDWEGPKGDLEAVGKRKIRYPCQESNPNFSVVQPLAQSLHHLSYPCCPQRPLETLSVRSEFGRAIAQAVSRRLPTAAVRIRAQVRSCGICGGQIGTGAGFLQALRSPLPILIPPTALHSSSSIIRGWYNRPVSGRRTKWTQSHPTPRN
jgi:hypothetical protein